MVDADRLQGRNVMLTERLAHHVEATRRPALVLSPRAYNERTDLCVACAITNQAKGFRFEVPIPAAAVTGVVLADQVRRLSWQARGAVRPEQQDRRWRDFRAVKFVCHPALDRVSRWCSQSCPRPLLRRREYCS
jgi:mRNA-degrading endonuclease toxin of MazEF toxin-antitoxin module